jgi:hypothetical protein
MAGLSGRSRRAGSCEASYVRFTSSSNTLLVQSCRVVRAHRCMCRTACSCIRAVAPFQVRSQHKRHARLAINRDLLHRDPYRLPDRLLCHLAALCPVSAIMRALFVAVCSHLVAQARYREHEVCSITKSQSFQARRERSLLCTALLQKDTALLRHTHMHANAARRIGRSGANARQMRTR